ncbi:MAG: DUF2635 domain-containing protein [Caulobacteraceae bacterium]
MTTDTQRYVRPLNGARVRDPADRQVLPEEGRTVAWDTYWERRKLDGDIEVLDKAPRAKPESKQEDKA